MTTSETPITVDYRVTFTIPQHLDDFITGIVYAACESIESALRDFDAPRPYNITLDTSQGEREVFDGTSDCGGCL